MDDYISKPVKPQQLAQVLVRAAQQLGIEVSSPPSQQPDSSILHPATLSRLREMVGGDDPAFMCELLAMYLTDTPQLLEALEQAFHQDSYPDIERIAHTLKSSSRTMGAEAFAEICFALEKGAAQQKPLSELMKHFEQLLHTFPRVKEAIEELMAQISRNAN